MSQPPRGSSQHRSLFLLDGVRLSRESVRWWQGHRHTLPTPSHRFRLRVRLYIGRLFFPNRPSPTLPRRCHELRTLREADDAYLGITRAASVKHSPIAGVTP